MENSRGFYMPGCGMKNLRPFTFNEKFAVGMFLLFRPVYLACAVILLPGSILAAQDFTAFLLWKVAWLIIGLIAFCAAVATIFFKPDHHPSSVRMALGRLLPLVALVFAELLTSEFYNGLSKRQMLMFAKSHSGQLAGLPPRAVIYREGIPDGDIAIVRSPGRNPEGFTQRAMIALPGDMKGS